MKIICIICIIYTVNCGGENADDAMNFEAENSDEFESDCDSENFENHENDWLIHVSDMTPKTSYEKVRDAYTGSQSKLEPNYIYE